MKCAFLTRGRHGYSVESTVVAPSYEPRIERRQFGLIGVGKHVTCWNEDLGDVPVLMKLVDGEGWCVSVGYDGGSGMLYQFTDRYLRVWE